MERETRDRYRVTIRYFRRMQQYEVFEVEAADLREAIQAAARGFPEDLVGSADLIEVRATNPAE